MARRRNNKQKYTSKGERKSSIKTAERAAESRLLNQQKAHLLGKRVVVTIENPNKEQTNKRFIRVLSSAIWAGAKDKTYIMN
jgi:hypothetical protein